MRNSKQVIISKQSFTNTTVEMVCILSVTKRPEIHALCGEGAYGYSVKISPSVCAADNNTSLCLLLCVLLLEPITASQHKWPQRRQRVQTQYIRILDNALTTTTRPSPQRFAFHSAAAFCFCSSFRESALLLRAHDGQKNAISSARSVQRGRQPASQLFIVFGLWDNRCAPPRNALQ